MSKKKRKHTNQKVYQVPSNAELDKIKENPLLNDTVKDDMITLHKINKGKNGKKRKYFCFFI